MIVNEKRRARVRVARFSRDDAQFEVVADGREHVKRGHVTGQVPAAGADAGVSRVGALLDDGDAMRRTAARRASG